MGEKGVYVHEYMNLDLHSCHCGCTGQRSVHVSPSIILCLIFWDRSFVSEARECCSAHYWLVSLREESRLSASLQFQVCAHAPFQEAFMSVQWIWTQVLKLVQQALYLLSHLLSHKYNLFLLKRHSCNFNETCNVERNCFTYQQTKPN